MKLAKSKHRILAFLFDWAIVFSITILILSRTIIIMVETMRNSSNADIFNLFFNTLLSGGISLIFIFFYFVFIPLLLKGQTLGKKFFGIRIVKSDGSEIDFQTLFLREIVCKVLVDFFCIGTSLIVTGFVLISSENHITFHDALSSTMVIDVD